MLSHHHRDIHYGYPHSLVLQEFMQMWVGYELVKVLRIFGLQPTGIREDLQSWLRDLYILFMYFKDKKKNAKME